VPRTIGKKTSTLSRSDIEPTTWRATERGFTLDGNGLSGELILRGNELGLRRVSSPRFGRPDLSARPLLLAVQSAAASHRPLFTVGSAGALPECRVRGRLVDVQLDPTDRCPVRMHIYWKATEPSQLDMEVLASSVQVLHDLEVLTMSRFPSGEVLIRVPGTNSGWLNVHDAGVLGSKWLVFSRDRTAGIMSLDGRSPAAHSTTLAGFYRQPLILYRPSGRRWSYVEMSRPDDCVRIIVGIERHGATASFGLFGLDIEKGVILRGRVRGIFVARANDVRTCLHLFSRFAAESPRLSV
jgi:hypothetical protein